MHLALLLQPGVAELLADGEHYWEERAAEEVRKVGLDWNLGSPPAGS
jgi:hypothetical protein